MAHLLVAVGLGIIVVETMLLLVQFSQQIRLGCYLVFAILLLFVLSDGWNVIRRTAQCFQRTLPTRIDHLLLWALAFVVGIEFLIASAPLTGSDAEHYHFTVQKIILKQGFHPLFSISHSFLCGQHHSLILMGLAFGSERLALGLIFLGGVLTAAVVATLSSSWAANRHALSLALLFLLTPVVFWQISVSGSPDIYMAFFVGACLLALNQSNAQPAWRSALIVGLLTGGIAGAKYTGCLIAAAVLVSFVAEYRSWSATTVFLISSVLGGISPYLRNTIWTANPIFPFFSERLSPQLVSRYALQDLAADTGASQCHPLKELFQYLVLAKTQTGNGGLWDFFGPTVLALFPLFFLAFKNTRRWRTALIIWVVSGMLIYFSSGLSRFMLPLFPVALACVAAGMEWVTQKQWRIANLAAASIVGAMCLGGLGGLAIYGSKPIKVAVGLMSRETYLEEASPEYELVQAINRTLGTGANQGKALVFIRHLYYLDVPYINGDPQNSLEVDPSRLNSADSWKQFLKAKQIAYIVRAAEYPPAVASPLLQLENQHDLVPYSQLEVKNLIGMRINQVTETAPVVILRVKP